MFIGRDLNKALIRYLENCFVDIARACRRYTVLTKNTYRNTVMKESQIAVMNEFVDNVKILIGALGYRVLEPIKKTTTNIEIGQNTDEGIRLHLDRNIKGLGRVEANGIRTSEGGVVLQGNSISTWEDSTIPAVLKEKRGKANIVDGILQEDVLLSIPSYAAMFVIGKSANGLTSWKDEEGRTLKEIENSETECR